MEEIKGSYDKTRTKIRTIRPCTTTLDSLLFFSFLLFLWLEYSVYMNGGVSVSDDNWLANIHDKC